MFLLPALLACAPPTTPPTWSADVKAIVQERCASCHTSGGSAPMALDTWEAMEAWSSASLAAMEAGTMPPWPADPDCRRYQDERLLADGELETFRAWVEAGSPRGDEGAADTPYEAPASGFSPTHTGAVEGYVASTGEADDWRCFVLDELGSTEPRYLHGTQVVPTSPEVHHVLVYALAEDQREAVEAADADEEGPGYTCFGSPVPTRSEGGSGLTGGFSSGFPNQIAGWVPGGAPMLLPDGLSVRIDADSVIVMQVHYSSTGGETVPDYTELQLELGTEPTDWLSATHPVAIGDIYLPAGSGDIAFTAAYPYYGEALTVRTAMAHMHMLGTQQTLRLLGPSRDECLLDIPDWDFHWQQTYVLREGEELTLAQGDAVELTCRYDNSAENQPVVDGTQQEPRDVSWGEGSLDEMCLAYLTDISAWTPPEDSEAAACAGTDPCFDTCGPEPTLDCLLSCPQADFDCFTCALTGAMTCGAARCTADLASAQDCLYTCISSAVMLGSNVGACLEAECPEDYAAVQACVDPVLASGSCDEALVACGVGSPA